MEIFKTSISLRKVLGNLFYCINYTFSQKNHFCQVGQFQYNIETSQYYMVGQIRYRWGNSGILLKSADCR